MKRKTAPKRPLRATATLSAYAATKLDYKQRTASCYSAEMQRWTTYPVKNIERKILSAGKRLPTSSRNRKGAEQLPTHNNRNKTMELHSRKFQSEQHHKRRGHFNYQSPTAKCQKYHMTYHTMKHPYVLRLRSTRKDAFFHRNKPFSPLSHRGL